MLKWIEV